MTLVVVALKPGEERIRLRDWLHVRHFIHCEGTRRRARSAASDPGWVALPLSIAHGVPTLLVTNDTRDFLRSDCVTVDVGRTDEAEATGILQEYLRSHPDQARASVPPLLTRALRAGLARADGLQRGDAGEGYGLRVSDTL